MNSTSSDRGNFNGHEEEQLGKVGGGGERDGELSPQQALKGIPMDGEITNRGPIKKKIAENGALAKVDPKAMSGGGGGSSRLVARRVERLRKKGKDRSKGA